MTPVTTVTRYAYVDTQSQAGQPTKVEISVADIHKLTKWLNGYGNPSYVIHTYEGPDHEHHTYLLVDEFWRR